MTTAVRKCQQCGQSVNHDDRYCSNCGGVVVDRYIPGSCPHCGEKLAAIPGALRCPKCKRKLCIVCRKCNTALDADAIFCNNCGEAVLQLKRVNTGMLTCGSPSCQQPYSNATRCPNCGALLLGQIIRGLGINEVLGQGGMGAVYLVESAKPPSPHVLKEMRPKAADPNTPEISTADLYANEVRVMSKLRGIDHTSQLLAAFEEEGIWFIAMTLLSGKTLDNQIASKQLKLPLSAEKVAKILIGVGRILEKIHAVRVVLRDLKPRNIMMLSGGGVALFDFGLGWDLDYKGSDFRFPSGQPAVVGTLGYAPKEQLVAGQPVAFTHDIAAWGATGYELATGVIPFDPKRRSDAYKWPHLNSIRNTKLQEVIRKAVSEDPRSRYQTIGEALRALSYI